MRKEISKKRRQFQGIVKSAGKMNKTIVVEVERIKFHPKYKKHFKVYKKYKVHDEKNLAKVGDKVIFVECRPLSREKRWKLLEIKK